jgi:hypothetical protein
LTGRTTKINGDRARRRNGLSGACPRRTLTGINPSSIRDGADLLLLARLGLLEMKKSGRKMYFTYKVTSSEE